MPRLSDTAIADIESSLAGVRAPRQRRFLIRALAARYGASEAAIYARIELPRKKRSDSGNEMIRVDGDHLNDAFALRVQTDGVLAWRRIAQAVDLPISPATLRRRAEAAGVTMHRIRKGRRSYRSFEAAHSNALQQIDETVSALYYIHDDGTLRRYNISPYKNRPQPDLVRLHFFMATDDHSRCKYARYYMGKGDGVPMQFLFHCWRRKEVGFLWGVPDAMYVDQDSIFKSNRVLRALAPERLNVEIARTMPKSPWSKGKVEKSIGDLERGFEPLIQYMDIQNIEQLNQQLDRYIRGLNWEMHGSTKERPASRWQSGLPKDRPVRLLPDEEIQRWLMMEQVTRKVDPHLHIRLKDYKRGIWMYYSLGEIPAAREWVGEDVTVSFFPGDYSVIFVARDGVEVEVAGQTDRIVNEKGDFDGGWQSDKQALIAELAAREVIVRPNWEKYLPAEALMPRIAPAAEQIESPMFARPATVLARVDGKYKANEIMVELAARELTYEERGEYNARFMEETVGVEAIRQWVEAIIRRGLDERAEAVAG